MVESKSFFIITVLSLQTIYNCILSTIGQFIYRYFLETYPNSTQNSTNHTNDHLNLLYQEACTSNTTINSAQSWAQEKSADLLFRMTLWRAFPVIVVTYLFGLYASRLNRRIILVLSIIGNALHVLIYLGVLYRYLPEHWWYVSAFIAGLSGGTNVIGIIMNLIITESTNEHERSSRFVRLGAITTGLSALASFIIGYYIQWRGFSDLLWTSMGMEVLTIVVVIFFTGPNPPITPSMQSSPDETTSLLSSNSPAVEIKQSNRRCCSECFDLCRLFSFKRHSANKSICLMLILFAYGFHLLAASSTSTVLWFLLSSPFCWTSEDLGNYSAVSLILSAILSVIVMKGLARCGLTDALICALGHLAFSAYILWIGLAKHNWELYVALLIYPLTTYPSALTVPMISTLLEPHERDNIFTLVTEISTIISAFGSSFFNWLYARTFTLDKSFSLYFGSGISVIPFILSIFLFFLMRSNRQEEPMMSPAVRDLEPATISLSHHIPPQPTDISGLCASTRSFTDSHSSVGEQTNPTRDQGHQQPVL